MWKAVDLKTKMSVADAENYQIKQGQLSDRQQRQPIAALEWSSTAF